MFALTVFRDVVGSFATLCWVLAAAAVLLALVKGGTRKGRLGWALFVAALFSAWPAALFVARYPKAVYERDAWAYFRKKCETEAGEKIYKTFTGVKSVLVVKPLPPAEEKDLFDQYWYGDPYSSATPHNERDISKADTLLRQMVIRGVESIGFDFVEVKRRQNNDEVIETISPDPNDPMRIQRAVSSRPVSVLGISWEDTSTADDRKYWVAASRLRVIDLTTDSIVAERVGFLIEAGFGASNGQRRPWLSARGIGPNGRSCPPTDTWTDRHFIRRVAKPAME